MITRPPDPTGDTVAGDPRAIDVESTFENDDEPGTDTHDGNGLSLLDRVRSTFERQGDDVIGGVCVEVATALGVDTLWVRLSFVVLALVGGLGVFLYAGLWLALIVGADRRWARITGGVIVIGLVPWFISAGRPTLATGTGAVLVLLAGSTLALWNRGADAATTTAPRRTSRTIVADHATVDPDVVSSEDIVDPDATVENPVVGAAAPTGSQRPDRSNRLRKRSPASPLGRATFGVAVVVAAAGALIDESNGGRLHPGQWLGAAAVVCGLGLLVGTIRGRGRWLIVPAAGFAIAGFVGGALAQAGVPIEKLGSDSFTYVYDGEVSRAFEPRSAFGTTYIDIVADPGPDVVDIDSRAVFGDVNLSVADDVTVLVRTDVDGGSSSVNGRSQDGTFTVGPAGPPDVVVDARVVRGDVYVTTYDVDQRFAETEPLPIDEQFESFIGEGVVLRSDGFVFIDDGEVILAPDNVPISGTFFENGGEYDLETGFGSWRLLGNLLITPGNELVDLDQARIDLGISTPPVSTAPVETIPESNDLPPQTTTVPVTTTVEEISTSTVPPSTSVEPATALEG